MVRENRKLLIYSDHEDGILAGSSMLPAPNEFNGRNDIFHKNGKIYNRE